MKVPCERCHKNVRKDSLRECPRCGLQICPKCRAGKKDCMSCQFLKEGKDVGPLQPTRDLPES